MTTKSRRKSAADTLPDIAAVPAALIVPAPAAQEPLRQALLQLKLPQLRAIAAARNLPARTSQREPLVAALVEHLLDPAAQSVVLAGLEQPARAILALALVVDWTRNQVAARDVARILHNASGGAVDQALTRLSELGLLVAATGTARYEIGVHLPAALVPGLLPLLPEIHAYSGDLPPEADAADGATRDLADAPVLGKIAAVLAALAAGSYRLAERKPRLHRGEQTRFMGPWEVIGDVPPPRGRVGPDERPNGIQVATGEPLFAEDGQDHLAAAAGLGGPDEAAFFVHLLLALNLLARSGRDLAVLSTAVEQFQAHPARERLLRLLTGALALHQWSELDPLLAHDPALALFRSSTLSYVEPPHVRGEVAHIRQALALLLAWLPVGPWYDVGSLLAGLHHFFPELPISVQPRAGGWEQVTWWLERADGAGGWQYLNRRNPLDWSRGLGRLAATALTGPFTWLGLVETTQLDGTPAGQTHGSAPTEGGRPQGATPTGMPAGVRLTALAGMLLSRRPARLLAVQPLPAGVAPRAVRGPVMYVSGEAGPAPRLHLDPRAVALDEQLALATCADPVRMDEDLCIYRLNTASARRGFDQGLDGPRLLALLERLAGGALPAPVAARIRGWWATYGRLRFYTGVSLISFGDDFTLAELLASTPLGGYILYQFSPRLIAVPSETVDRLLADLQRAGHTPRVVDESLPVAGGAGG